MKNTALLVPVALCLLGTALPLGGCSSDKNHEAREAAPEAQGKPVYRKPDGVAAADHQVYLKQQCIGPEAGMQSSNGQPPQCTPDPGSRPVDSARAEAGTQFAWVWDLAGDAKAWTTFTYDDNTTEFVVPDRYLAWEPPADPIPLAIRGCVAEPCLFKYPYAARFYGGPFTEYGGGFGQSLRTTLNTDGRIRVVDGAGNRMMNADGTPVTLPPSPEYPDPSYGAYDLRTWTGVAIWVRRGQYGQSTMRIGVTERNSAEDLNSVAMKEKAAATASAENPHPEAGIEEGKYCRRWRLCGCAAGTPCSPLLDAGGNTRYYCFDPAFGTPSDLELSANGIGGIQACGETRCKQNNTSSEGSDPLFVTQDPMTREVTAAACNLYQTSDGRSDMFCYDPKKDPPPPAKRERCNNPYSRPFTVTTDWQLIKIPFTELLQADESLVADDFDLASIKQIAVTHSGGWRDFWVANLGFYKKL
jgi:hypothetical protein